MGRVDGKVAFITGAARGQGRSHALRLAEEGADIVAVDICRPVETAPYEMATPDDLAETAKLVEDYDRRIVARQADVRDLAQLQSVVEEGLSELGHIDVVCANAGIAKLRTGPGDGRADVAGDDRHQPVRRLEDHPCRRASHGGAGPGWFGHHHQLGGRPVRLSEPRQLLARPSTASSASCACSPRSWRRT